MRDDGLAAAAPAGLPGGAQVLAREAMEVRFFVPGGLVSNLDFVECIFGNAGDPYLPENDAGLDVDDWTGHTGCVILAPASHPAQQEGPRPAAREPGHRGRSARAGMCWADEDELYNDGRPSSSPSRGIDGVMVTILADNYFGYCKKEVKTQIGYTANLFGLAEEEHAGGALAFATFNLGDHFVPEQVRIVSANHRFAEVLRAARRRASTFHPTGYATDTTLSRDPLHAGGHGDRRPAAGHHAGRPAARSSTSSSCPGTIYIHPSGYKVRHGQAPRGAELAAGRHGARGRLLPQALHRVGRRQVRDQQEPGRRDPATGRSTSRSFEEDMALVEEIFDRDYADALLPELRADDGASPRGRSSRPSARSAR